MTTKELRERLNRAERRMGEASRFEGPRSRETYMLAELLYGLGWEPGGDAQLTGLEAALPTMRTLLQRPEAGGGRRTDKEPSGDLWICANGHASRMFLKTEIQGDRCLFCQSPVRLYTRAFPKPEPPAAEAERDEVECITCGDTGIIDNTLGGWSTDGTSPCPDCRGRPEATWKCAKCGHGSEEHGMPGHPAHQCVADMRLHRPEAPVGTLEQLRDRLALYPEDTFGRAAAEVTHPTTGEADVMRWPIRDEMVDTLSRAIAEVQTLRERVAELEAERVAGVDRRLADFRAIVRLQDTVAELEARLKGSEERAQLLFDSKNRWADRARAAEAERDRLRRGINAVGDLMVASYGVAGLHLNGDVAPWETLRTGGEFEDWLVDFDRAQPDPPASQQGGRE